MNRREFLSETAAKGLTAMAIPFLEMPDFLKDVRMGIVVHSYATRWNSKAESKKYPGFQNAIELLEHCHSIGAGGLQVGVRNWTTDFSKKMRDRREKLGLYLEGSIASPSTAEDLPRFENDVIQAKEAGAVILRTVTSGGRRYEVFHSPQEVAAFKSKAMESLKLAEPILKKHKAKLAVENHKDWRADELAHALKQLSSEWVGVTLDFGNSIALVEDPMEVVETLVPFIFSTHVKDMGVEEYKDGFLLSEVPLGKGFLDLPRIVALCKQHNAGVTFNLEMITRDPLEIPCFQNDFWTVFDGVSGSDFARTLRMIKQNKYETALPRVAQLSAEERLAVEEDNILQCLRYSEEKLKLI